MCIDAARRLIHDENLRVGQHRASERDELLLPGRKLVAPFADSGRVAFCELFDERVRVGHSRGGFHLGVGRIQPAVADVLADRSAEQMRLLQHHPEAAVQPAERSLAIVDSVDEDQTGGRFIKAADERHNRTLPAAGRAYQRNRFAGLHGQVEIVQHRLTFFICERHVAELDRINVMIVSVDRHSVRGGVIARRCGQSRFYFRRVFDDQRLVKQPLNPLRRRLG